MRDYVLCVPNQYLRLLMFTYFFSIAYCSFFLYCQVPAETGTLIFLCGGDAEVFESQAAALDAMGKVTSVFFLFLMN